MHTHTHKVLLFVYFTLLHTYMCSHKDYDKLQRNSLRTTVKSQLSINLSTNFLVRPSLKRDKFGNPQEKDTCNIMNTKNFIHCFINAII